MGEIEDIYADLDADVSEEQFREAVEQKVEQMGGLTDETAAAMLVAHELTDEEVETIADVEPGMEEVKFVGEVRRIGDLRTFERDGEDEDGCVINVEVADESGSVRLAFWDGQARSIDDGALEEGDVLRIKGRPKEGYNGLEVSVDEAEVDEDAEIDVNLSGSTTVESLTMGQSDVTLAGVVLDTERVRTFERDDGSEGRVANLALGDETGRVRVTLWDEKADRAEELDAGTVVEVVDGYVRERDGDLELHVGDRGAVEELDEEVTFVPETEPIAEVELDQVVDIGGVVRSTDPKRTFERDDGSEGQVRNVRLQDDTDDIRVALWGEEADVDVGPGDELFVADAEIEDGWQDDLEASAGWRSTVVVLDDESSTATASTETTGGSGTRESGRAATGSDASGNGDEADHSGRGLDAFANGDDPETGGGEGTVTTVSDNGGDAEGEPVEFTGTVVQTGDPVILDDGQQTLTVETDEVVRLGEEVTVRGKREDDRLDADEVF